MANKITVKFEAQGAKALKGAIDQLYLAQVKLEKGTKAYEIALRKLNAAQGKNNKVAPLGIRNNRLLANSFATLRSKLLLASFGFALVNASIGKLARLFGEQQLAEKKLETALGRTSKGLLSQASALQRVSTFGDETIISAQALIAAFVDDEEQIKAATAATLDLAAAKGMDLNSAADLVSKTLGSSTNSLSRYGIEVEGAVGSTERLNSLTKSVADTFGGQAKAQAETFLGSMKSLSNVIGDLGEKIGSSVAPLIQTLADNFKDLITLEVSTEVKNQTEEFLSLLTVLKQNNISTETRNHLLKTLNKEHSSYVGSLKLEKMTTQELQALNDVTERQTREKIANLILAEGLEDLNSQLVGERIALARQEITIQRLKNEGKFREVTFAEAGKASAENEIDVILKKIEVEKQNNQVILDKIGIEEDNLEIAERAIQSLIALKLIQDNVKTINLEVADSFEKQSDALDDFTFKIDEYTDKMMNLQDTVKGETWNQLTNAVDGYGNAVKHNLNQELKDLKKSDSYRKSSKKEQVAMEEKVNSKYRDHQKILFRINQAQALSTVFFSTQEAVAKSRTAFPATFGEPWASVLIGLGVAQAAAILSQKMPAYEQGGYVGGQRHAQGGTMINAERGEFVMSRNAVESVGVDNLEAMNQGGGGASIVINNPIISSEFVETELPELIAEAVRKGANFGMS